jgi:transposase
MLQDNNTAKVLDMEDVKIIKVENLPEELHVHIELPRKVQVCPRCGKETNQVHDYRTQRVKDIPFGRNTILHLRKRRYTCPCCNKHFPEKNPLLPRYYRITRRCIAAIIQEFRELKSASAIAKEFNVSTSTALRYFQVVSPTSKELPRVLSIDEFKGDADKIKYQTILTDPEHHTILDILPNRFEDNLIRYFMQFDSRDTVKYFVTDMNPHFRAVAQVCFPNAQIVVDRYHVTRQVMWAMENVRKNEQKNFSDNFRKYFKRSKRLLNKEKLSDSDKEALALMLELSPRLAKAYRYKEEFLHIMHTKDSQEAKKLLSDWLLRVSSEKDLKEFSACVTAYQNWSTEILTALDVPYSNGFTEGCNNKIKVLKRVSFGIRSFKRFRRRILYAAP